MDYTREPIVETIITPRDGYRLAVRNSKAPGQEEYTVEALEVVSFGANCFFRNQERPKAFMVPASDYEVLEVRESRLPLKAASYEGTIRLPPHREPPKSHKETEKRESFVAKEPTPPSPEAEETGEQKTEILSQPSSPSEPRNDRRRDRRRGQRRRRPGREDVISEARGESEPSEEASHSDSSPSSPLPLTSTEVSRVEEAAKELSSPPALPVIIPPPTTLIRDDLERLRRNKEYEGAFYIREPDEQAAEGSEDDDAPVVPLRLLEEETRAPEEVFSPPQEENTYKATPAPLEEEMEIS